MTFKSHPELPGFPTHTFDVIDKEHYYFKNYTGRSSRECELTLQFRTVPGQTTASIKKDLTRLLAAIKREHPAFNCTLEIPARGTSRDGIVFRLLWNAHRITLWFAPWRKGRPSPQASKATSALIGRLGNVGDGNIIQEKLGIPTVQYGPGDIRIYKEWPTPDERVLLADLVTAAKAVAHATVCLCG